MIAVSSEFEIIQLEIKGDSFKKLPNRQRNQIVGCMHAQNELGVLNRLLMFSLNNVGDGELHDAAHGVQMWCLVQVLTGKLFETWNILTERFLKAKPEDPAVAALSDEAKKSLAWLKGYFGKKNALRTIRDKTGFHYDQLNLDHAVGELHEPENRIYLAQHPANALYYAGSVLVFKTVFAMITDNAMDAASMTNSERVAEGVSITLGDVNKVNQHLHAVLYGLIVNLLVDTFGKAIEDLDQLRIPVVGAPTVTKVGLPMFIDVGPDETLP